MYRRNFAFVAILLLIGSAGCARRSVDTTWPEPRPLGENLDVYQAPAKLGKGVERAPEITEPSGVLTLRRALSQALMRNPELAAHSWEVRAAEARALQSGLRPNPEIEVEIEEFGGTGARSDLDGATITPRLSQLIELGGKRSKRTRAAALESRLAGWDYESKRLDVLTEVNQAFVEVLATQERLSLAEELVLLSGQIHRAVSERVAAGRVSPLEEAKASVILAMGRIDRERAGRNLKVSRKRLAATWGTSAPVFEKAQGRLDQVDPIPSAADVVALIPQSPEVARWEAEMEQRRATVDLEKSARIPDVTLSGGVQQFNETDDHAFVMQIAVPLPIFDRNQGAVLEAERELAKAAEDRKAVELSVRTAVSETYEMLAAAYSEVTTLRDVVLPAAEQAFEAAGEGYRRGKLGYLDLLDAQRTYFEAKGHYIDALTSYHKAVAGVERLIGQPITEIEQEQP